MVNSLTAAQLLTATSRPVTFIWRPKAASRSKVILVWWPALISGIACFVTREDLRPRTVSGIGVTLDSTAPSNHYASAYAFTTKERAISMLCKGGACSHQMTLTCCVEIKKPRYQAWLLIFRKFSAYLAALQPVDSALVQQELVNHSVPDPVCY